MKKVILMLVLRVSFSFVVSGVHAQLDQGMELERAKILIEDITIALGNIKQYLSECDNDWKEINSLMRGGGGQSALDLKILNSKLDLYNTKCIVIKKQESELKLSQMKLSENILKLEQNLELQKAIIRMNNNGLTSFQTVADFNGDGELTREQASKFFVQFTKMILRKFPDTQLLVSLSDLKNADKTLQPFITESNQLGLFKGVDGKFYPFNKLTRAQAIAVLMRAKDGHQNESNGKRYSEYYNISNNYGLLSGLGFDSESLDVSNIKRKEIALMLYRLGNK